MEAGWFADPSGRHAERFWENAWTSRVRDMGVESVDVVGADPAPATVPSFASSPSGAHASSFSPGVAGPSVPPPTMTTPYGSSPPTPVSAPVHRTARNGLPGFLVLAIMIASFPALISFGVGFSAMSVGTQISGASGTGDAAFDTLLTDVGNDATTAGAVMFILGIGAIVGLIATGRGSNAGRIITAVWMSGLVLLIIAGLSDTPGDSGGIGVLMIGVPVIGIVGLFTPMSNEVFRKDSPFG